MGVMRNLSLVAVLLCLGGSATARNVGNLPWSAARSTATQAPCPQAASSKAASTSSASMFTLRAGGTPGGLVPAAGRRVRVAASDVGTAVTSKLRSLDRMDYGMAFAGVVVVVVGLLQKPPPSDDGSETAGEDDDDVWTPHTDDSSDGETGAYPALHEWHALDADECIELMDSSGTSGLSAVQATNRLALEGPNELTEAQRPSLWAMVVEQFNDRLVQILLAVAIFSAVTSYFENNARAFVEPTVIIMILVLNAAVGVWQSRSAEGAVSALRLLQPSMAAALRDGEWQSEMPAKGLVPGDVVLLRVGDKVPADARLLQFLSSVFSVDEGSLTGESATVAKALDSVSPDVPIQGKTNMVFSGTMITAGSAYAMVTATGMHTEIGKIQAGVQAAKAEEEKTPLGQKLDAFGAQLSSIIGFVCLAVWLINFPRFFDPIFKNPFEGGLYYLKIAVALGVAAIPEGLPAVITLCLSLGTRRMADRNVIVRKLPSVETLGCTTVICTDKTGTLTTNQMTVTTLVHVVSAGTEEGRMAKAAARESDGSDQVVAVQSMRSQPSARNKATDERAVEPSQGPMLVEHAVGGLGYSPQGAATGLSGKLAASACLIDMIETGVLCNDAALFFKDGQFQRTGEPTEAAIKVLAEKLGKAVPGHRYGALGSDAAAPEDACRQTAQAVASNWQRIATLDFNRDRKSMSVVVRPRERKKGNVNRLLVKGAPDLLLRRCTRIKLPNGATMPLTGELRRALQNKIDDLAERPLRTIGFAVKEGSELNRWGNLGSWDGQDSSAEPKVLRDPEKFAQVESGLIFVGLCGINDPARHEVADSIRQCSNAGIRIIMITGDSKPTAVAIARDVNIFSPEEYDRQMRLAAKGTGERNSSTLSELTDVRAFTGSEFFSSLSEEEQMAVLNSRRSSSGVASGNLVFCRTEPMDKQKLVKMLQRLGETPAMTGDGVNDAPALQQAAIGVAMGITGTEVAKEAADMVLADDNFATIVAAVEEGRSIYNNMQSFVCFLISCNFGEIATVFFATLFGLPEPLTSLQLLWVNLVTDGPPATALGFNPPSPDAMSKPPRSRTEPILTRWLLLRYVATGLYVGSATIGIMVWWFADHGVYLNAGVALQETIRGARAAIGAISGAGQTGTAAGVLSKITYAPSLLMWGKCGEWASFSPKGQDLQSLDIIDGQGNLRACNLFSGKAKEKVQTMALSVLVCTELLKALSAISVDASLLTMSPFRNPLLVMAVVASFGLHFFVLQTDWLARQFGLTSLTRREWKMVAYFAVPILLFEEILKFIGRRKSAKEKRHRDECL